MDVPNTIADAVTTVLNQAVAAGAFAAGVQFTAVRKSLHEVDLAQTADLLVLVAVQGYQKALFSRAANQWTVLIDVVTTQRVPSPDPADVDPLMALIQTMATKAVLERNLNPFAAAEWIGTNSQPYFNADHLRTQNRFTNRTTYSYMGFFPR